MPQQSFDINKRKLQRDHHLEVYEPKREESPPLLLPMQHSGNSSDCQQVRLALKYLKKPRMSPQTIVTSPPPPQPPPESSPVIANIPKISHRDPRLAKALTVTSPIYAPTALNNSIATTSPTSQCSDEPSPHKSFQSLNDPEIERQRYERSRQAKWAQAPRTYGEYRRQRELCHTVTSQQPATDEWDTSDELWDVSTTHEQSTMDETVAAVAAPAAMTSCVEPITSSATDAAVAATTSGADDKVKVENDSAAAAASSTTTTIDNVMPAPPSPPVAKNDQIDKLAQFNYWVNTSMKCIGAEATTETLLSVLGTMLPPQKAEEIKAVLSGGGTRAQPPPPTKRVDEPKPEDKVTPAVVVVDAKENIEPPASSTTTPMKIDKNEPTDSSTSDVTSSTTTTAVVARPAGGAIKRKLQNELQRLNEDIRTMFIGESVRLATGKRKRTTVLPTKTVAAARKRIVANPPVVPPPVPTRRSVRTKRAKAAAAKKPGVVEATTQPPPTPSPKVVAETTKLQPSPVKMAPKSPAASVRISPRKRKLMRKKAAAAAKQGKKRPPPAKPKTDVPVIAAAAGEVAPETLKKPIAVAVEMATTTTKKRPPTKPKSDVPVIAADEIEPEIATTSQPGKKRTPKSNVPVIIAATKMATTTKPTRRQRRKSSFHALAAAVAAAAVPPLLLKNTNIDWHSLNAIEMQNCRICSYRGGGVVAHQVNRHRSAEVTVARLSPQIADALRNPATLQPPPIATITKVHNNVKIGHKCHFCNTDKAFTRDGWIVHFSQHTGEFRFGCTGCNRRMASRPSAQHRCNVTHRQLFNTGFAEQAMGNVVAAICSLCNYTQFAEKRVRAHLQRQHGQRPELNGNYVKRCFLRVQHDDDGGGGGGEEAAAIAMANVTTFSRRTTRSVAAATAASADSSKSDVEDVVDEAVADTSIVSNASDAFVSTSTDDLLFDAKTMNMMNVISFNESDSDLAGGGGSGTDEERRRRQSMADRLSERFKSVDCVQASAERHGIEPPPTQPPPLVVQSSVGELVELTSIAERSVCDDGAASSSAKSPDADDAAILSGDSEWESCSDTDTEMTTADDDLSNLSVDLLQKGKKNARISETVHRLYKSITQMRKQKRAAADRKTNMATKEPAKAAVAAAAAASAQVVIKMELPETADDVSAKPIIQSEGNDDSSGGGCFKIEPLDECRYFEFVGRLGVTHFNCFTLILGYSLSLSI